MGDVRTGLGIQPAQAEILEVLADRVGHGLMVVDPGDRAWSNGILEPGNLWTAMANACGVDATLNPNHITISGMRATCGRAYRNET